MLNEQQIEAIRDAIKCIEYVSPVIGTPIPEESTYEIECFLIVSQSEVEKNHETLKHYAFEIACMLAVSQSKTDEIYTTLKDYSYDIRAERYFTSEVDVIEQINATLVGDQGYIDYMMSFFTFFS